MITVEAKPRWRSPQNPYKIEGTNVIVDQGKPIRKITGTSIGAMLGISAYNTPFTASCGLFGLNDRDLQGNQAVATGVALEPRIIDYLSRTKSEVGSFIPAESIFSKRDGNHEDWISDWEDPDYSGHLDGIVTKDGKDYVLEIKTVKSIDNWNGRIPEHYLWQLYLYNHFVTQQDKAYFGIGVVTDKDYQNPDNWQPNSYNCMLVEVEIDRVMVASEIDRLREIRAMLADTRTITSFNPDNKIDVELLEHLRDYNASKEEIIALANRASYLSQSLKEQKQKLNAEEMEFAIVKSRLKDIMLNGGVTSIGDVYLKIQNRVTYDIPAAIKDGLDMDKYATVTETPALCFRKR